MVRDYAGLAVLPCITTAGGCQPSEQMEIKAKATSAQSCEGSGRRGLYSSSSKAWINDSTGDRGPPDEEEEEKQGKEGTGGARGGPSVSRCSVNRTTLKDQQRLDARWG